MKMMRCMVGRRRKDATETWVEWLQRVTPVARSLMKDNNVQEETEGQKEYTRRWQERLAIFKTDRWAVRAVQWQPEGRRCKGRPCMRWPA